jgi:hypothetical protein
MKIITVALLPFKSLRDKIFSETVSNKLKSGAIVCNGIILDGVFATM